MFNKKDRKKYHPVIYTSTLIRPTKWQEFMAGVRMFFEQIFKKRKKL